MKRIRSLLCIPAHKPALYNKALATGADALMIDLEDSVPAHKKEDGLRVAVEQLLCVLPRGFPDRLIFVRVNPFTDDCLELLDAGATGALAGIVIPKIKSAAELLSVDGLDCGIPLLPVIETPQAILNLESIFAVPSVVGGIFGVADFAAGMGVSDRVAEDSVNGAGWSVNARFAYAKQRLATVAAAYGKQALDTCFIVKGELAAPAVREGWLQSRSWGFTGGAAIHPMQVRVANGVFGDRDAETAWATETTAQFVAAGGEVTVDRHGMVVGMPVARQAAAILGKEIQ